MEPDISVIIRAACHLTEDLSGEGYSAAEAWRGVMKCAGPGRKSLVQWADLLDCLSAEEVIEALEAIDDVESD